mmetsp:Transcript_54153/g.107557  ORF Transcript_54153/g.107557 Transcript_54153/m.107557 type:complete len:112 (+) Transcript_54153:200-535(+)
MPPQSMRKAHGFHQCHVLKAARPVFSVPGGGGISTWHLAVGARLTDDLDEESGISSKLNLEKSICASFRNAPRRLDEADHPPLSKEEVSSAGSMPPVARALSRRCPGRGHG